jgi:hypothetical protein
MFLPYASRFGQTLIDRRLYHQSEGWASDAARPREDRPNASVP